MTLHRDPMLDIIMDAAGVDVATLVEPFQCDFCCLPIPPDQPAWVYPARDIVLRDLEWASRGGWASCATCKALIDADDYPGLTARSVATYFDKYPAQDVIGARTEMDRMLKRMHAAFKTARTGPAEPAAERPVAGTSDVVRHRHDGPPATCPECIAWADGAVDG